MKWRRLCRWGMLGLVVWSVGCKEKTDKAKSDVLVRGGVVAGAVIEEIRVVEERESPEKLRDTEVEKGMRELGLVDIREVEPSIQVYLIYATADNFVGKVLYHDIHKAFMLPEAANRLKDAQRRLKVLRPDLSLLVYDAARPMSVQQEMWARVSGTDKRIFVSNPKNGGGLHNYGAAVDLTLADSPGNALSMGSPFDYFGDEARPDREEKMVRQGKISPSDLDNRRLLRHVMTESGFRPLQSEWWHFNLMSREEARIRLKVID